MTNNIDNGYAYVLFELGKNNKQLEHYFQWSDELLTVLQKNKSVCEFIANTNIDKTERKNLITELVKNYFDDTYIHFLWTIVDFNRTRDIIEILKLFLKLCQQFYGIQYVQITSAYKLSDTEIKEFESALKSGMNFSKVTIHNIVDPTLIGGIKLKTNAISIDDSIKSKLRRMRESSFKLAQGGE